MAKALVLTGINGARTGDRVTLSSRTNIVGSSSDSDLLIQDRTIMKRHAEVRQVLERWFVVPLEAGAAVFVNSAPVASQGRIVEGDLLTFGNTSFRVAFIDLVVPSEEKAVGGTSNTTHQGLPRLGDYLVRRGVLTQNQVTQAVQRQNDLQRQGRRVQIGELMYQMGFVTRSQLDHALQEQHGDFLDRLRD